MEGLILVVDDQEDNRVLIADALEEHGYKIIEAENGEKALEMAASESPDVIVLDIQMPGLDGYEVCKRLKSNTLTTHIPIIFLTAIFDDEDNVVRGLDLGAYDFLSKPFREKELIARINVMVRIKKAEDGIRLQSYTDALTGLHNRRFLEKRFIEEASRSSRASYKLSCFMIDIDHFKSINDMHGHPLGDFVLQQVSGIIKTNLRSYDLVARFGGEEFVVLLPTTTYHDALLVAEKLRKAIEEKPFIQGAATIRVTISIGVYTGEGDELTFGLDYFVSRSDQALYKAKGDGRNRVVGYPEVVK